MSSEDLTEFFRAFGRLEAEISAVKQGLDDLRSQLREGHARRWTAWAGAIGAIVSTVMAAVAMSHLGIHN